MVPLTNRSRLFGSEKELQFCVVQHALRKKAGKVKEKGMKKAHPGPYHMI